MYEIHKQSRFPKNKFQSQFYRSMSHPVSYYVISSLESFIYINFSPNLELETVQLESYEFHWAFIGAPSLSLSNHCVHSSNMKMDAFSRNNDATKRSDMVV